MTDWQTHEKDVQTRLNLSTTIASGNRFYDPGDGIVRGHYTTESYPVIVDCKATSKLSYRLDRRLLEDWREKAQTMGKHFLLPLRFIDEGGKTYDWLVKHLDDEAELLQQVRSKVVEETSLQVADDLQESVEFLMNTVMRTKDPTLRLKLIKSVEIVAEALECQL